MTARSTSVIQLRLTSQPGSTHVDAPSTNRSRPNPNLLLNSTGAQDLIQFSPAPMAHSAWLWLEFDETQRYWARIPYPNHYIRTMHVYRLL